MTNIHTHINVMKEKSTGILELARPEVFNCLSMDVFREIDAALKEFEADPNIRSMLIRAQGKHFCTGAELGEVKRKISSEAEILEFLQLGHGVLRNIEASRLPIVAQVQGLCLAGGLELTMACDIVFAARSAKFGDQHGQFGLIPGWGGSQRLPRLVGLRRAMDLFMSVRWIEAEQAERWGLITYVADDSDLGNEAMAFCAGLAERSSEGLAVMKRLARNGLDFDLSTSLDLEVAEAARALRTAEVAEGITAFEEKRKPNFN